MIVQTIKVNDCTPQTIVIGRRGTYDTLQIAFDLSYLVESYGNGVAVLAVKRSQDSSAYPAVTSQEDDLLLWTVSETDTFYVGAGEAQLMWYVDGGLAKTIIYPMVVMKDILMTSEEAPDAYQEWVDALIAEGAKTLQNAQDAAQSASDAEQAKDDAVTAKEAAEAALEEFTTPTALATTLSAGSQATATYSDGNFAFGIPRGADGSPGAPGTPGADGVTPDFSIGTVTTLEPTQPATATITGTTENPVLNLGIPKGAKGDPGQGGGSVNSVNGQTGNVVLDAGDIAFSSSGTYDEGTVGAEVSAQKNAISQLDNTVNGHHEINYTEGKNLTADPVRHSIVDDADSCISDYIPVAWTGTQAFWYSDDTSGTKAYQLWYFDSSKNYLGYRGWDGNGSTHRSFDLLENTAYIVFSFKKGYAGKITDNSNTPSVEYWVAGSTVVSPGIVQKMGDIADLDTTDKSSLVAAVNEVANNLEPIEDIVDTFEKSPNLYDASENVVGLLLASNGDLYPNYTDFVTSGYIPVTPGATLRAQYDATLDGDGNRHDISDNYRLQYYTSCFYDASKVFIAGSGGNNTKLLTVPTGAAYFRFTLTNASATINTNIAIIESASSEVLPYVEPNSIWYLEEQYIPASYDEHIKEVVGLNADGIILNVPSKIYAVTGIELNVYFENITEDWTKYQWDVTCTKGKQMVRGYSITPSASDVGEYPITIRASIDANTYKEVTSTLVVTALSTGTGLSVIVLGDSTTDNGQAVTKIHTDFEAASTTVQTLGTRGTAPNNHEGRAGWRAYNYVTTQSSGSVDNPFYNPSTSTFDAAYYFANSGVSVPDWFFINLGINDVFGYVSDEELNPWIPTILGYYDTMVTSLKSAAPNMKIGICVTIPPNDSQDAFGKDYACSQTRDRCKRNNTIWAEKLIEHFSGQEAERVYLVPIHVNLDTVYNMGLETVPVNARNTSVTYQSPTANGGVHPSESGYWQIADVYTAFLKAYAN